MSLKERVTEIMVRYEVFPNIINPMEELTDAFFTADQYIETVKEFRNIYPELCEEIIKHLNFLLFTLDNDLPSLEKISLFLKSQ